MKQLDIFFENMPVVHFRQMTRNSDLMICYYVAASFYEGCCPSKGAGDCMQSTGTNSAFLPLLHKNEVLLSCTFALRKTRALPAFQTIPPCLYHPQLSLWTHTHMTINLELFGELCSEGVTNIAYQILVDFFFYWEPL